MAQLQSRLQQWTATIAEFALAQGFAQAAGMLSGLIYVRVMPVDQYALYALCLVSLSVISVGSDLGISGALSYFWRKSLQDGSSIAPKVTAVRRLRGVLFMASMAVGAALLFTSVKNLSVSTTVLLVCFGLVAATAWLNVHVGIDILLARLEGRQRASYLYESAGSAVRLTAALTMLAMGFASAWFGLAGGLLGAIVTIAFLARRATQTQRERVEPTPHDWRDMRAYVLPLMPSVLVYMIQDPLVLWLAAIRGGAIPVAEVHALGRIAALFSLIGTFSYVVMTPRLARISDDRAYVRATCLFLTALLAMSLAALLLAQSFPEFVLLLIGIRYAHLTSELIVSLAAATLAMLTWFLTLANRVRGWIALDPIFASLHLMIILGLCFVWNFETSAQVVRLTFVVYAFALLWPILTFVVGITRPALVLAKQNSVENPL